MAQKGQFSSDAFRHFGMLLCAKYLKTTKSFYKMEQTHSTETIP